MSSFKGELRYQEKRKLKESQEKVKNLTMPKPRKELGKSKQIIVTVGFCRYCHKELINTDSFVFSMGVVMLIINV